jgi:large subunit GTPase 1
MPRQGGQGKGKPKKKDRDFGRALIRQHSQGSQGYLGTKTESNQKNMASILEVNALDDYIDLVEMDDVDVKVKRYDTEEQDAPIIIETNLKSKAQELSDEAFSQEQLVIPRKPKWTFSMSAEEVDRNEKNAFMEWRRHIAEFESSSSDSMRITPFEKNLEVWRQLWRVCERSNIVIQVVDGRNPLLFYTGDLSRYLSTMDPPKRMVLLVNKSDLLTTNQRLAWKDYFNAKRIKHMFYSAFDEQSKLDHPESTADDGNDPIITEQIVDYLLRDTIDSPLIDGGVLTRLQLLDVFQLLTKSSAGQDPSKAYTVGLVGYPNVGKSSCINTMLGVTKSNHGMHFFHNACCIF